MGDEIVDQLVFSNLEIDRKTKAMSRSTRKPPFFLSKAKYTFPGS